MAIETLERLCNAAETVETLLLEAYNKVVAVDEVFRAAGVTADHRIRLEGFHADEILADPESEHAAKVVLNEFLSIDAMHILTASISARDLRWTLHKRIESLEVSHA